MRSRLTGRALRPWQRKKAAPPRITWNDSMPPASTPWRMQAWWECCCRALNSISETPPRPQERWQRPAYLWRWPRFQSGVFAGSGSLVSCASLACIQMGLTVEEAFLGITKNAALALGRPERGWIGSGAAADLSLFALPPGETASASLIQYLGSHRACAVIRDGQLAWSA